MKKINQLLLITFLGSLGILCVMNIFLFRMPHLEGSKAYRISFNRIQWGIQEFEREKGRVAKNLEELTAFAGVEEYPYITGFKVLEDEEGYSASRKSRVPESFSSGESQILNQEMGKDNKKEFWNSEEGEYAVIASEHGYYKIFYVSETYSNRSIILLANVIAGIFLLLIWIVLWYVRQKILLPFSRFLELPYELAKGNLTLPFKENKDKFFGKFLWGMDVLRENLEENKVRELELQKEKKLLLLSLSHDIKTPLSAIHLYAQALCRNLYKEEAKKLEIARNIKEKAEEMEGYIREIVKASNEDFLDFQVENGEIYIGNVLEQIRVYYQEKMALNQVEFLMYPYSNCLVWGDLDRLIEVIQNVVENALKYGDGRKIQVYAGREEEYLAAYRNAGAINCQDEWPSVQGKSETFIIIVRNTGCELAQKELPHVFDSFFRGSNVGRNSGSGLGLYICRQLMHLMEGEITAGIKEEEGERWMEMKIVLHLV